MRQRQTTTLVRTRISRHHIVDAQVASVTSTLGGRFAVRLENSKYSLEGIFSEAFIEQDST
jgi:hypothetical protein